MNIDKRKEFSETRLQELGQKINNLEISQKLKDICIFVCGSYGRKEAHKSSDVDVFFIALNSSGKRSILNKIDKILFDAALIKLLRDMKFPEMSNDGEYLEVHKLDDILEELGGPLDDHRNYFTTRLLLILESAPVFNKLIYDKIIDKVVGAYFRDYENHENNFKPIFLLNDIVRFWKTLCLNYERKRNKPDGKNMKNDSNEKAKHRLKNLKLKFSRKTICYSMIIPLSTNKRSKLSKRNIVDLIKLSPLDRLKNVARENDKIELFNKLANQYSWFLKETSKKNINQLLLDEKYKTDIAKKASGYSLCLYELLKSVASDEALQNITI